jgi:hypothetical protein
MGTDSTPTATLAKCKLNTRGEPISNDADETTVFIPHFNASYKIVLYVNSTDADNNTTANAVWVVDNISGVFDASDITYTANATVTQKLNNLDVDDYTALRAVTPAQFEDGDTITVTDAGIAGPGNIRKVTAHGLSDNGGTIIVIDTDTYWSRSYDGPVNAEWFLEYDGTDDNSQLVVLLQAGFAEIDFPAGTPTIDTTAEVTLTADVKITGAGVLTWGGASTINWMLKINSAGFSCDFGISTNGNNLVGAGLLILNTTAMSGDLPTARVGGSAGRLAVHKDFKMNAAGIFNEACTIQGSFEYVDLSFNHVKDISRAAGTGTPGSSGTTGMIVSHSANTYYPKKITIHDNIIDTITSEDAAGANDVDQDGIKVQLPDPSNFDNTDTTLKLYPRVPVESYNNKYINCRGRAEKFQCVPHSHHNTVIRNGDRTINSSSVEINPQWGVGSVHDIDFYYDDYAGPTSPISTGLTLVSFYQGTDYGEQKVGASVRNLRIFNGISAAVNNTIDAFVSFQTGSGPSDTPVPVMTVRHIEMAGGDVDNYVRTAFIANAYGLLVMDDISAPLCNNGAIGTTSVNTDITVKATGVVNLDGINGGSVKNFVASFTGSNQTWSGDLMGFGNLGWADTYNRGADFGQVPKLTGAALADPNKQLGGVASVQSVFLGDDVTYVFDRRGFTAGNHIFIMHCNQADENGSGVFYSAGASAAITEKTDATGTIYALGTGSNPDTDNRINLWMDANGELNVKNRLGSSKSFTVTFIG